MKQPQPNDVGYRNKMGEVNNRVKSEIVDEINNGTMHFPSADIDLSVEEYARMLCSIVIIRGMRCCQFASDDMWNQVLP